MFFLLSLQPYLTHPTFFSLFLSFVSTNSTPSLQYLVNLLSLYFLELPHFLHSPYTTFSHFISKITTGLFSMKNNVGSCRLAEGFHPSAYVSPPGKRISLHESRLFFHCKLFSCNFGNKMRDSCVRRV